MNRLIQLTCVLVVLGAPSQMLVAQQKARVVVPANRILPMATSMSAVTASPATISFTATDPDLSPFAGNSAATISWTTSGGSTGSTWNLTVSAAATSFTNCATVPRSAVQVSCSGITGGSAGVCGGPLTLSGAPQQIASGKEASGAGKAYSVTLSFSLTDSWSYIAGSSCTLSLTYTVTAP